MESIQPDLAVYVLVRNDLPSLESIAFSVYP